MRYKVQDEEHDEVQEEVGGHGVHSWKTTSVELGLLTSFVGNHLQVELQGLLEKDRTKSRAKYQLPCH